MKYLFVGGPPRSGTTAFAQLLNWHPKIAIGIERYKYAYRELARRGDLGPALFESGRFFDIRNDDTNIRKNNYPNYDAMRRRYGTVHYRGDKLPGIWRLQKVLDAALPQTRYLYILRDIFRVCSSWNERAANGVDHWPPENDYRAAVQRMNADFKRVHALAAAHPRKYMVVSYEALFGDEGNAVLDALLGRLGLAPHPDITAQLRKNADTVRLLSAKPFKLDEEQRAYVEREMDWSMVEKLGQLTVKPGTGVTA